MARHAPAVVRLDRPCPRPTVLWVIRRERRLPDAPFGWGQERLRHDLRVQVAAKIDDQEPIVAVVAATVAKKPKHQRLGAEDGAVDAASARSREHRVLAAQPQQIDVERVDTGVALTL